MQATLQQLITLIGNMQRESERDGSRMLHEQLFHRLDALERKVDASLSAQRNVEQRVAKLDALLEEREFVREHTLRIALDLAHAVSTLDANLKQLGRRSVTMHEQLTSKLAAVERTVDEVMSAVRNVEYARANNQQRFTAGVDRLVEHGASSLASSLASVASDLIASTNATLLAFEKRLLAATIVSHAPQQQRLEPSGHSPRLNQRQSTRSLPFAEPVPSLSTDDSPPDKCLQLHNATTATLLAKFNDFDNDVEVYTRKVLNSVQDLSRSADRIADMVTELGVSGNATRTLILDSVGEIFERLDPLIAVENSLLEMRADIDAKFGELTSQIHADYVMLLAAQNEFIKSCDRVQSDESHLFTELEHMMDELLNSSNDNQNLINTLNGHNALVAERLEKIYGLLVKVVKRLKQERAFDSNEHGDHSRHANHCQISAGSVREIAAELAAQLRSKSGQTGESGDENAT